MRLMNVLRYVPLSAEVVIVTRSQGHDVMLYCGERFTLPLFYEERVIREIVPQPDGKILFRICCPPVVIPQSKAFDLPFEPDEEEPIYY